MHSHSDWRLWGNRRAESKIRQGVTTEVVGNCGFSPAPVATEFVDDLRAFALYIPTGMDFAWRSVGEYLQRVRPRRHRAERRPARRPRHAAHRRHGLRAAPAHRRRADADAADPGRRAWTTARGACRPGSSTPRARSRRRRRSSRWPARPRAIAASTPATFAARAPRCSTPSREAIRVGREGSLPVQVSHIKAAGRPNWGKVADALALIDAARAEGLDVMARRLSVHRLQHVAAHAAARLGAGGRRRGDAQAPGRSRRARAHPRRARGSGEHARASSSRMGWENVMISSCPQAQGRRGPAALRDRRGAAPRSARRGVRAAARRRRRGVDDPLPARRGRPASARSAHPAVMIGSDGSVAGALRRDRRAASRIRAATARSRACSASTRASSACSRSPRPCTR